MESGNVRRDSYETDPMAWILLIGAGILETGFAVMLKLSDGFSKLLPTILFAVFALASFGLLNLALRDLPVGTAYAVWTGIGAAGTAVVGILVLDEPADALRIAAISLIVIGAVGLQAVEQSAS
jgi:quaternary ammonium compound-resistance protein SugE